MIPATATKTQKWPSEIWFFLISSSFIIYGLGLALLHISPLEICPGLAENFRTSTSGSFYSFQWPNTMNYSGVQRHIQSMKVLMLRFWLSNFGNPNPNLHCGIIINTPCFILLRKEHRAEHWVYPHQSLPVEVWQWAVYLWLVIRQVRLLSQYLCLPVWFSNCSTVNAVIFAGGKKSGFEVCTLK